MWLTNVFKMKNLRKNVCYSVIFSEFMLKNPKYYDIIDMCAIKSNVKNSHVYIYAKGGDTA